MQAIIIESNIPMPGRNHESRAETLRKMKIGDSFIDNASNRTVWYPAAGVAGCKIVTRRVEGGKLRIWKA